MNKEASIHRPGIVFHAPWAFHEVVSHVHRAATSDASTLAIDFLFDKVGVQPNHYVLAMSSVEVLSPVLLGNFPAVSMHPHPVVLTLLGDDGKEPKLPKVAIGILHHQS